MQAYPSGQPCYLEVTIEALTDLKTWGLSKVVGLEMLGNNEKCQDFKGGLSEKKWGFQCGFVLLNLRCLLERTQKTSRFSFGTCCVMMLFWDVTVGMKMKNVKGDG